MTIVVRRAAPLDAGALRALQGFSLRRLAARFYHQDVIEAFMAMTTIEDLVRRGTYFAACSGSTLIGCGGWSPRDASYVSETAEPAPPAHATIRSIFVHPDWTGRNVARHIIAKAESDICSAAYDGVSIMAPLSAVPLYRKLGYQCGLPVTLRLAGSQRLFAIEMLKPLMGDIETTPIAA
jgi:GNAT superfamily N-acetyltransferase